MFKSKYEFKPQAGEPGGGPVLVERAGYIPAKIQIENLIDAGKRLKEHRKELYDVFDGEGSEDEVLVRKPNYDLADASQEALAINARMQKRKAQLDAEKAAEEAANKAEAEAEPGKKEE